MYDVFITRKLPYEDLKRFEDTLRFEINMGGKLDHITLLEKVVDKDAIICTLRNKIDCEVMDKAGPNLKVISNYAVGYDNIDIEEATKRKIYVTNTPEVLTETTADLAWALIFAVSRRVVEANNYILNKKWVDWHPLFFAGRDIHGKTLGIIGLGRIGTAIAKRSLGFNMNLIYYSRTRKLELEKELNIKYMNLESLLEESDFVVLSVPLTPETKNLIGKKEFSLFKNSTYIINISRGPVINENALISALKNNQIAGAGLDVFDNEPVNFDNPLLKLENVVLTPHIGSATIETRTLMAKIAFENVYNVLTNNYTDSFIVNPFDDT
jgi:glyoxylate reductase